MNKTTDLHSFVARRSDMGDMRSNNWLNSSKGFHLGKALERALYKFENGLFEDSGVLCTQCGVDYHEMDIIRSVKIEGLVYIHLCPLCYSNLVKGVN